MVNGLGVRFFPSSSCLYVGIISSALDMVKLRLPFVATADSGRAERDSVLAENKEGVAPSVETSRLKERFRWWYGKNRDGCRVGNGPFGRVFLEGESPPLSSEGVPSFSWKVRPVCSSLSFTAAALPAMGVEVEEEEEYDGDNGDGVTVVVAFGSACAWGADEGDTRIPDTRGNLLISFDTPKRLGPGEASVRGDALENRGYDTAGDDGIDTGVVEFESELGRYIRPDNGLIVDRSEGNGLPAVSILSPVSTRRSRKMVHSSEGGSVHGSSANAMLCPRTRFTTGDVAGAMDGAVRLCNGEVGREQLHPE